MIELEYTKTVMYFKYCFLSFTYICIAVGDLVIKRGEVGVDIPLTDLNPPHVCACPKAGNEFPTLYTVVFVCPMSSVEMI